MEERDCRADGEFILGVISTGIYCRPSCPARRPLRKNVRFYDTVQEARADGLRACLRCDPDASLSPKADLVKSVTDYIESHLDRTISLAALSEWTGVSRFHLQRTFRAATGLSPREYADAKRTDAFKAGIRKGKSLMEAQLDAGVSDTSGLGMTPRTFQRGGEGQFIRFATAACSLGFVLVAATDRGICAVELGDSVEGLSKKLADDFVKEVLVEDRDLAYLPQVIALLERRPGSKDLPLDVRSTAFQALVWNHLQSIPRGETRTYQQVADAIGRPSAVRAVANACGKNPTALLVPCHRVVATGGGLGGYRWGVDRKRQLLESEQ